MGEAVTGMSVGAVLGTFVGEIVGAVLGTFVGEIVGAVVGADDGSSVVTSCPVSCVAGVVSLLVVAVNATVP